MAAGATVAIATAKAAMVAMAFILFSKQFSHSVLGCVFGANMGFKLFVHFWAQNDFPILTYLLLLFISII